MYFASLLTICITPLEILPLISFFYFTTGKIFIKFYSASNWGIISLSLFCTFTFPWFPVNVTFFYHLTVYPHMFLKNFIITIINYCYCSQMWVCLSVLVSIDVIFFTYKLFYQLKHYWYIIWRSDTPWCLSYPYVVEFLNITCWIIYHYSHWLW